MHRPRSTGSHWLGKAQRVSHRASSPDMLQRQISSSSDSKLMPSGGVWVYSTKSVKTLRIITCSRWRRDARVERSCVTVRFLLSRADTQVSCQRCECNASSLLLSACEAPRQNQGIRHRGTIAPGMLRNPRRQGPECQRSKKTDRL
jgi:hypothetical protein